LLINFLLYYSETCLNRTWNLSKQNLLGTNFCVQNRQLFSFMTFYSIWHIGWRYSWFSFEFLEVLFLVPYRRKPKGTIVLGSVRHIKILSCPNFFFGRPLIYWLDIWYVAISRWVTVLFRISFRPNDFWLSYGPWTCILKSRHCKVILLIF
jgi:hypothetical protein